MAKWGMVIDLEKCTGCQACSSACQMENTRMPGENWQDVLFYDEGKDLKWFPRPCMQCEEPSCVTVCPTRATYKNDDGTVTVDWNRCIGCKYCMIACPYGVRFYMDSRPLIEPDVRTEFPGDGKHTWKPPYRQPESQEDWTHGVGIQPAGVVSKCTFCYHRIIHAPDGVADLDEDNPATKEYTPACVRTCPPKARFFGDLDNPDSKVNQLIAEKSGTRLLDHLGNKPQVYYLAGESTSIPGARASKKGG